MQIIRVMLINDIDNTNDRRHRVEGAPVGRRREESRGLRNKIITTNKHKVV